MKYLRVETEDYDLLVKKDPAHIQMDLCQWISFLRQKGKSSSTISTWVAAINKFYTMNDITTLNWKKIKSYQGEREKVTEDRPYTHSEIKLLVENTTLRNKAVILLMSSSGCRVGAVPLLRIKDLEPVDKHDIYKITYYPKSRKFRYFSFCTPECRKEIDQYIEWRKRWGEHITEESQLFRREFNPNAKNNVTNITDNAICFFTNKLLRKVGIRPPTLENLDQKRNRRHNIMQCHGFRKFFETNTFKAGMDNMYLRRLMGQKSGLEDAYLKLTEEELLEGDSKHVGYIGIIDQLTINEENKLRRKVETLTEKKDEIQKMKDKHEQEMKSMREDMNKQFKQVMEMIQQNPKLAQVKPEVLTKQIT
jgi:integrase